MNETVNTDRWGASAQAYLTSSWHANEAALAHLVEVAAPAGGRYLDIATGAGHAAFALAPHVDRVIASDSSAAMLKVASREAIERRLDNLSTVRAEAVKLPFSTETFDGIVCRCACHHFADLDAFLIEARRALRPGGMLLLIDTVGSEIPEADNDVDLLERLRDPTHVRNYTAPEWRRRAKSAGYTVEYEDQHAKPLNAKQWMERQAVPEDLQPRILDLITESKGWFREYLRPHGDGDMLTFHLSEITLRLRK